MPKKQHTTLRLRKHHRNFARHVDYKLIDDAPEEIRDYCPDRCMNVTAQLLLKERTLATKHGSRWGTLKTVQYICHVCNHVYTSQAWKENTEQMSFLDMVKVSDRS